MLRAPALVASAVVAIALAGSVSTAAADGLYFTESVGGTDVKNELGSKAGSALRFRFSLGYRINKNWAVEGFMAGDIGDGSGSASSSSGYAARCIECGNDGPSTGGYDYNSPPSLITMGIDVKYIRPVSDRFEVYLRGSLGKGWLDTDDYSGRGLGIGAGAQIKGKVPVIGFLFWPLFFTNWGPKVTAALFADAGSDFYRLHRHGDLDNSDSIDASMNRFTIGWAVGADF